jgi:hypothetical protein
LPSSDGWGTLFTEDTNPRRLAMNDASDITRTVDTYLAMWNETDPGRRAEHIERVWTRDGRYVDPLLEPRQSKACFLPPLPEAAVSRAGASLRVAVV